MQSRFARPASAILAAAVACLAGWAGAAPALAEGKPAPDQALQLTVSDWSATEGDQVGPAVAFFTDPDAHATSRQFAASVSWGDGTSTGSALIFPTQSGGQSGGAQFAVTATHVYADAGTYTIAVRVLDLDNGQGGSASASATAQIQEASLSARGTTDAGTSPYCRGVASFTDANAAASASEFTATIDWGDGSTSTATVSGSGSGPYWAQGCHGYTELGPHNVTTTIVDGALSVTSSSTIYIWAPTDGGTFVVGDGSATPGSPVTYWGGDWHAANALSAGPAPAAFKGFATGSPPICSGSWSSRPGASSNPPASVPSYTAVLVASTISTHGSEIDGDSIHVALIRSGAGYGPDPGSPGSGTVVLLLC